MAITSRLLPCISLCISLTFLSLASWSKSNDLVINNCHLGELRTQVKCGKLSVPENYQAPDKTKLSINFAVLPAIDNSEYKTPLMFLAGGPGQSAVELATSLNSIFYDVRKTRDIILIDQRGTGKSGALTCDLSAMNNVYSVPSQIISPQEVKTCVSQFKGDIRQFNTENAIRDFDAVRAALGHNKVNIYGGSYGTRAGLTYMRMFPDSIDTATLDSVAPIEVPVGLFGQSGARSFNLLLENCKNDINCQQAFPNLAEEFKTVKARLAEKPVTLKIQHPRLGTPTDFVIDLDKFTGNIRFQLYSMNGHSMVPLVIHQAFLGNYLPLQGLMARNEGEDLVYTGLLFNIVCNEDIPRLTANDFIADADNEFDGDSSQKAWQMVCPYFPQFTPSSAFNSPVVSDIPTLVLSGNLDPVTPPSNGDYLAKHLSNSHHIVVDDASHTVAMSTCANKIINEFLSVKNPTELDESCLAANAKTRFMTSVNGIFFKEAIND